MGNGTARLCKAAAACLWAAGGVAAVYLGFSMEAFDLLVAAGVAAGCFVLGLFTWAAGEAAAILHDIRARMPRGGPAGAERPRPGLYVEDIAAFKPAEPEADPLLQQIEPFVWVCAACGEINLSGSDRCRICKAERAEAPKA